MPRKKVTAKEVKKEDVTALSFFECEEIIRQIQMLAADQDGEISDEQMDALVEAQTQSPAKLTKLCNFVKLTEGRIQICKDRKKEINEVQKRAEKVLDRICDRVAVWVEAQGKTYHAAEYELKSRRSKSVELVEGFDNPMFCSREIVLKPDKAKIKEALESGEEVPGATVVERINLSIK